jgi:hypothetical protein
MLGELIFVTTASGELLPSEIRTLTRYADGWAVNTFRPFPTAKSLSDAIQQLRPNWASIPALKALVDHLSTDRMTAVSLKAPQLPGVFDQEGAMDVLPDFGDEALVRELLTKTTFVSSYNVPWKAGASGVAFAPSTESRLSIVPTHYEAGLIEVNEKSCLRCHKETGRHLTSFKPEYRNIVLYGELWGRDGIFSFHPFDESRYGQFWNVNTPYNRRLNPALSRQGVITNFNRAVHVPPDYPTEEIGAGKGNREESSFPNTDPKPPSSATPPSSPGSISPEPGAQPLPPSENRGPSVVEFRIRAGTGRGEWNTRDNPVVVRPGQAIRIINDDTVGHVLHTDGRPCPHGDTSRSIRTGGFYDCAIPRNTPSGSNFLTWDHFLGSPNSGRFWIRIE